MPWREPSEKESKSEKVTEEQAKRALDEMNVHNGEMAYFKHAAEAFDRYGNNSAERKAELRQGFHKGETDAAARYETAKEQVEAFMRQSNRELFEADGILVIRRGNVISFFSKME